MVRPSRETIGERSTTHGESSRPGGKVTHEYKIWCGLKNRCLNKNSPSYGRYGGRGIIVCSEWVSSYETFLDDMGRCPKGYTIDRIDNNGPYSKENCQWVTKSEQARNRRSSVKIYFGGVEMLLIEVAESLGVPYHTLYYRRRRGADLITGKKITGGTKEQ